MPINMTFFIPAGGTGTIPSLVCLWDLSSLMLSGGSSPGSEGFLMCSRRCSGEHSRRTLCRWMQFPVHSSPLPRVPPCELWGFRLPWHPSHLSSEQLLGSPRSLSGPRPETLQVASWNVCRVRLIHFASLRDPYFYHLKSTALKTTVWPILSIFLLCCMCENSPCCSLMARSKSGHFIICK